VTTPPLFPVPFDPRAAEGSRGETEEVALSPLSAPSDATGLPLPPGRLPKSDEKLPRDFLVTLERHPLPPPPSFRAGLFGEEDRRGLLLVLFRFARYSMRYRTRFTRGACADRKSNDRSSRGRDLDRSTSRFSCTLRVNRRGFTSSSRNRSYLPSGSPFRDRKFQFAETFCALFCIPSPARSPRRINPSA